MVKAVPRRPDSAPPLRSSGGALAAAIGAAVITAVSVPALAMGALGVLSLAGALTFGVESAYAPGIALLAGSVVLAGVLGLTPPFLLAAAFLVLLAWDVGKHGFGIAREVGREPSTFRIEAVHGLSSALVYAAGATLGYGIYAGVTGGRSVVALLALLVGSVALLFALRT